MLTTIGLLTALSGLAAQPALAAVAEVPEAAGYTLLYDLAIPVEGGFGAAVPWTSHDH